MLARKFLISLLCAVLWLTVSSLAFAGTWQNDRYDPAHTAYNVTESFDPRDLTFRWSRFVGNAYGRWSMPVIVDKGIVVGIRNEIGKKFVQMLRKSDGTVLWSQRIPATFIPTSPVVRLGNIFIAGDDFPEGYVYKYDMAGRLLWRSDSTDRQYSLSDPVVSGRFVYISAAGVGTDLLAFSTDTGKRIWKQWLSSGTDGTPAVSSGKVFGAYPGHFYALNASKGTVIWHRDFRVHGGGGRTPTVGSDLVYMIDRDWAKSPYVPIIYALNKETGATAWTRKFADNNPPSDTALTPSTLFLTDKPKLRALDPSTGAEKWAFDPDTNLIYAPVVAGDYLFVASAHKTYAVHIPSRTEVWSADVGGKLVVAQKWVLVTEDNGWVTAYKAP